MFLYHILNDDQSLIHLSQTTLEGVYMNHKQLLHIFAQREKPSGKCGTVFFDGDTAYSHGTHFPLATFHDHKRRGTIVLLNSQSYSNTTSKHQAHARHGIVTDQKYASVLSTLTVSTNKAPLPPAVIRYFSMK